MSLIEDIVQKTLDNMPPDERGQLILGVVERMLAQMSAADRLAIMDHVVDRFMDGLSSDEKQAAVRELVPNLLATLMRHGNMNVDELLWAAMGSLGALDGAAGTDGTAPGAGLSVQAKDSSRDVVSE